VVPIGDIQLDPGPGAASGQTGGAGGNGDGARSRPTDLSVVPAGAKRAELFRNAERAPEIIPLYGDEDIDNNNIKGRAARFVMQSGQLFVNMQYPSIAEMRTQLEAEYADTSDAETMRALVKQTPSARSFCVSGAPWCTRWRSN
jgi:hypothetical protein